MAWVWRKEDLDVMSLIAYELLEAGTFHLAFILLAVFLDMYWALTLLTLVVMEVSTERRLNGEERYPLSKFSGFFYRLCKYGKWKGGLRCPQMVHDWMLSSVHPIASEVPCLFATHGVLVAIGFLRHRGCSATGHFTVHLRNFPKNRERAAGHCTQKLWSSAWSHCQVQKHSRENFLDITSQKWFLVTPLDVPTQEWVSWASTELFLEAQRRLSLFLSFCQLSQLTLSMDLPACHVF